MKVDFASVERIVEAWPSAPRFELRPRREEGLAAARAEVGAGHEVIPKLAREGSFGPLLAQDMELLLRKLGLPLAVRLFDFLHGPF